MKICYLADAKAIHIKRWAEYFAHQGHDVSLITLNPETPYDFGTIEFHIVRKKLPGSNPFSRFINLLPALVEVKSLVSKIKPDILHAHAVIPYAYLGALVQPRLFMVTPWGNDVLIDVNTSKIENLLTRFMLGRVDLITCDGENTKDALVRLGVPEQRIKIITFGVNIQKFKPASNNREEIRRKLFLSKEKIVVSTRFLTQVHNLETLVKAIPLVLEKFTDVQFVIIGGGPEKEYLMDLARLLNVSEKTRFAGNISEEEMIPYLQAADVYISTSLSESGLAASTAEAMACELPIINTDTGDIRIWLRDDQSGFIVPVKNPVVLAEKIIHLLIDDERRIKMGQGNRQIIEKRNNYHVEMGKMENIYQELVGKRRQ
jgi:glycosyltransferase involved in cell wall biosynthesis